MGSSCWCAQNQSHRCYRSLDPVHKTSNCCRPSWCVMDYRLWRKVVKFHQVLRRLHILRDAHVYPGAKLCVSSGKTARLFVIRGDAVLNGLVVPDNCLQVHQEILVSFSLFFGSAANFSIHHWSTPVLWWDKIKGFFYVTECWNNTQEVVGRSRNENWVRALCEDWECDTINCEIITMFDFREIRDGMKIAKFRQREMRFLAQLLYK